MAQALEPIAGIDDLLLEVQKPSRYLGGELNAVVKDPRAVRVRFGLAFPDTYEVGMSNVGFRTLYHALNARPDTACERFFMPWVDLEALMRGRSIPLFSLENRLPARAFDVLGFSMQFELCYPTVLAMLDLAGIPLFAKERGRDDPLILGGGPCAYNPEPVADFFDALVIGEGEEAVHEISDVVADWKVSGESRRDLLWRLSDLDGVYVPSLFRPRYAPDRTLAALEPLKPGYERITRRVVPDLNAVPMPERPVMPFMQTIHDRLPIEIQRGCTRGCRFCQVGMLTRPTRQRSPDNVRKLAESGLAATGYEEVGFLSLSAGDYDCINGLLEDFFDRFAPERVAISLPSLRTETMNARLAEQIRRVKKSGFTVAPEAATERMRRVINKGNKEENLLDAVESIFQSGWSLVKFYFMIGLPTESDADVRAIVQLSAKALQLAKKHAKNPAIHVGVSTFVPKPFTPFQWEPMIPLEETRRKHALIRAELGRLGRGFGNLKVRPHDATQSSLEGALALGDRRMATVVLGAFRRGQRLDSWTEHFRLDAWHQAEADMLREHGVDLAFFAHRRKGDDEVLPWDHIDCDVTKPYLWKQNRKAVEEAQVVDCAIDRCSACGACDYFAVDTRVYRQEDYRKAQVVPLGRMGEAQRSPSAAAVDGLRPTPPIPGRAGQSAHPDRSPSTTLGSSGTSAPSGQDRPSFDCAQDERSWPQDERSGPQDERSGLQDERSWLQDERSGLQDERSWLQDERSGLQDERSGLQDERSGPSSNATKSPSTTDADRTIVRVTYAKEGRLRALSHLETKTALERAIRRAKLPVAYTQGFSPKPKLAYSPALPVGIESQAELMELTLVGHHDARDIAARLAAELPPGLSVLAAEAAPALPLSAGAAVVYRAQLAPDAVARVDEALDRFAHAPTWPVERAYDGYRREIDLKKFVRALARDADALTMEILQTQEGTARPAEVVQSLVGCAPTRLVKESVRLGVV